MKNPRNKFVFAFALFCMMGVGSARASQYEISQFRQAISQLQVYEQQYQSAPSGSYQEQVANQNRVRAEANAEAIISSSAAFQGLFASDDQNLLNEFENGYQAAPSGSLLERAYNTARTIAESSLASEAGYELQNTGDYTQALALTLNAENAYQAASSGSLLETAFNSVRSEGWSITAQKLQDFAANQLQDFRQAEALFLNFEAQYQAASSGSSPENFYNNGRVLLSNRTLEIFTNQISGLDFGTLNNLLAEYNAKYQAAASGSQPETLYRSMVSALSNALNGGYSQPSQPPVYNPPVYVPVPPPFYIPSPPVYVPAPPIYNQPNPGPYRPEPRPDPRPEPRPDPRPPIFNPPGRPQPLPPAPPLPPRQPLQPISPIQPVTPPSAPHRPSGPTQPTAPNPISNPTPVRPIGPIHGGPVQPNGPRN